MQRDRLSEPDSHGLAALVVGVVAVPMAVVWAAQIARAVANVFAGGGWQLPPAETMLTSTWAVLTGHAEAGLSPVPGPEHVASTPTLFFWLLLWEALVIALAVVAARTAWNLWGPNRVHGAATPKEAEDLLGLKRLRHDAPVIRPDLYGKRAH